MARLRTDGADAAHEVRPEQRACSAVLAGADDGSGPGRRRPVELARGGAERPLPIARHSGVASQSEGGWLSDTFACGAIGALRSEVGPPRGGGEVPIATLELARRTWCARRDVGLAETSRMTPRPGLSRHCTSTAQPSSRPALGGESLAMEAARCTHASIDCSLCRGGWQVALAAAGAVCRGAQTAAHAGCGAGGGGGRSRHTGRQAQRPGARVATQGCALGALP